jgi:hypothetical protein
LKHYCADEAFFLMEMFSTKAPTFSEGDPFRIIAEKLYEAVTGRKDADMERACDWILKERRKVRQHSWLPLRSLASSVIVEIPLCGRAAVRTNDAARSRCVARTVSSSISSRRCMTKHSRVA